VVRIAGSTDESIWITGLSEQRRVIGGHTWGSNTTCGPDRSGEQTLCAAMLTHAGEKINGDVVASGSAARVRRI
jgi:hypothetical protein